MISGPMPSPGITAMVLLMEDAPWTAAARRGMRTPKSAIIADATPRRQQAGHAGALQILAWSVAVHRTDGPPLRLEPASTRLLRGGDGRWCGSPPCTRPKAYA